MKNYIIKLVDKLIRKYKTRDPFELAALLHINVWERDIGNLKGFYNIFHRERYIVINQRLSSFEKREVCAHELGHDRLHQHFAKYTPLQDIMVYDMTLKPEREANIFGTSLLVTDNDILNNLEYTSEQIAQILGVSNNYIQIKLDLLNLCDHSS